MRGETRREIYEYILEYALREGMLPTIREIGEGVGLISTSSVESHMRKLESEGLIERVGKRYRVRGLKYGLYNP